MPENNFISKTLADIFVSQGFISDTESYQKDILLKEDLGMDSLEIIHLIIAINEAFDINTNSSDINVENFGSLRSVEAFVNKAIDKV